MGVVMEAIKFLKYILSRIGIMIVLTLFSAFAGIVLIPALVTVFPSSTSAFKNFMTNSNVDSFIGFAVCCCSLHLITFILVSPFPCGAKLSGTVVSCAAATSSCIAVESDCTMSLMPTCDGD